MVADLNALRMLVLDVDGVLTDGGIYIAADGNELKRFSIHDGLGIKMAIGSGLAVAVISGHGSQATIHRFEGLGVKDVVVGAAQKTAPFEDLLQRHGLRPEQVAVVGDDLPDIPIMRAAGFSATVPAAPEPVKAVAHMVTERQGGHGAVREVIEFILGSQGKWDAAVAALTNPGPQSDPAS